jgi:hypothetical protein
LLLFVGTVLLQTILLQTILLQTILLQTILLQTILLQTILLVCGVLSLVSGSGLRPGAAERKRGPGPRVAILPDVYSGGGAFGTLGPYAAGEAVAYALLDGPYGAHADHEGDRGGYEPLDEDGAAHQGWQVREPV